MALKETRSVGRSTLSNTETRAALIPTDMSFKDLCESNRQISQAFHEAIGAGFAMKVHQRYNRVARPDRVSAAAAGRAVTDLLDIIEREHDAELVKEERDRVLRIIGVAVALRMRDTAELLMALWLGDDQ